jgi:23S rRNA pseudouridine1911/1915/1917 synthase
MPDPSDIELDVLDSEAGERLDKILSARPLGISRSVIQRWLADGRVTVDGVVADRKTRAKAGSHVIIAPEPPPRRELVPEDLPLEILFEDEHLIVIDKAPGMVVHPAPGHDTGTLVHALLGKLASADETDERPGIVHRLDKDTSGVMVVARTSEAHEALVRMFQAHDLERRYLAIARGHTPDACTFDTMHARHPTDRKRFTSRTERGRRAVTHLRTIERLHAASYVECRLMTGRTHQIRVHLADAGHALLGDPVYGGSIGDPRLRDVARTLGRQALHAAHLEFAHPMTGERLSFTTEPPEDFKRALAALRGA